MEKKGRKKSMRIIILILILLIILVGGLIFLKHFSRKAGFGESSAGGETVEFEFEGSKDVGTLIGKSTTTNAFNKARLNPFSQK